MAGWEDRVAFSDDADGGFAYVPNQIIVLRQATWSDDEHLTFIRGFIPDGLAAPTIRDTRDRRILVELPSGIDVSLLVDDLSDAAPQLRPEPNVVLFAHSMFGNPLYGNPLYGNPLYGNPLYGNPLYGNPLYGNSLYGNPLYGNPLYGNPLYGNPLYGNPLYGNPLYGNPSDGNDHKKTGLRQNSACPASEPKIMASPVAGDAEIFILDSGLAGSVVVKVPTGIGASATMKNYLPADLNQFTTGNNPRISRVGWRFDPNGNPKWTPGNAIDDPDAGIPKDGYLDPVAGHGTFIAGLVELLAPGHTMHVDKLLEREGDVDVWHVCHDLGEIHRNLSRPQTVLINMSFGGYSSKEMHYLPARIRAMRKAGVVFVASAGNDGICRRSYPACIPGVVSVGALGPNGPAPFSNWGPWVRACAPGTNVVSYFFNGFNGKLPTMGTGAVIVDPDNFKGWARWSGTSFAAPEVVAALAREMARTRCTAREAVERVVDGPGLAKIVGLGTIVNIA